MKRIFFVLLILGVLPGFCFSQQKRAFLLPEVSINKGSGTNSIYPGLSFSVGARLANSLLHPGFGINGIIVRGESPVLHLIILVCDDKSEKITPAFNVKIGISTRSHSDGTATNIIETKGGLYLAGNAGILFAKPKKGTGRIFVNIGYSQTDYKITSRLSTIKSTAKYLNLSMGIKI